MNVVFNPACLEYRHGSFHPESPERVKRVAEALENAGYDFHDANPASEHDVLLVHAEQHLEMVRSKKYFDADTPPLDIKYPLIAAGCTIKAAKLEGFALTRPPGHHAGRNFLGGFCYFNNIAIAIRKVYPSNRVAILDIDAHHGNGTQDIFLHEGNVLYVSLHQHPLYPGTGKESMDNCINFPLPPGTGEKTYLKTLEKALSTIENFSPDVVAISLGFDTYEGDPLASFLLRKESYAKIAGMISRTVSEMSARCFAVLEGGYSNEIGKLAVEFFDRLGL